MVVDAAGGPVCDATVVVRDGSYVSELMQINCVYFGAHERAGTYSIDVTTASATERIDGVKVSKDACHVITRELTINMDR
jgi:hypothetical protein